MNTVERAREARKKWARSHKKPCPDCGKPIRHQSRYCLACAHKGPRCNNWKGGRIVDQEGYVNVYAPDHPYAWENRVREHRLVMEQHLGRTLLPTEVVHHIDGNLQHNVIENLMLFTPSEHSKHHAALRRTRAALALKNAKKGEPK